MSKINQIQKKLKELEGGIFQKLCDAYLHKKGYERLNPLGSVIGSNKVRKGTPDSLISLPNGKFIFSEYTSQEEKVYKKLKGDLERCFDVNKTGVPIEKIQEVVFCHTSLLSPEEENLLAEECQKHDVNLNIFGIGPLSYDLYQKYPGLARDFLGIEVDTGQILSVDEFVSSYNKNKLATPLDTSFHFRDDEVTRILKGLEENDIVIVSGRAGVGKSRLAIECCSQFQKTHSEYKALCLFNRGPDLFEDLRVYLSEPGHYLVLVDDANRLNRFDYVLQYLDDTKNDRKIKIIATVRDYALNKITEVARSYLNKTEIEIIPFEKNQIKKIVEDNYSIHNPLYLDQIANIAQGNPRLAIMAALIAIRENTLRSINDVTELYDDYYSSIRKDLEELGNPNLLKTAGIIAFFRFVDRSSKEMMISICTAFDISAANFWDSAQRLHKLELVDMYENELVKISDQVLATYLFYLAYFKEREINFSIILANFFPQYRQRLIDAINPILNILNAKAVINEMRPHVDKVWKSLQDSNRENDLLHLIDVFWFLDETHTLLYIQDQVIKIEVESKELAELDFKPSSDVPTPSILSVLSSFKHSNENSFRIALEMILTYLDKRPKDLPNVLYILTERLGFDHRSYLYKFIIQRIVVDVLWNHTQEGKHELFSKIFLIVAEKYLQTHFHATRMESRRTFTMLDFDLPPSPEIFDLRHTIWSKVFILYHLPSFKYEVIDLLHKYCTSGYLVTVKQIIAEDSNEVIAFIKSSFNPNMYSNCHVAQNYFDFLVKHDVPFDAELSNRFSSETFEVAELLLYDWTEKMNLGLNLDDFREFKKEKIRKHFSAYSYDDFKQFIEQCIEIMTDHSEGHKEWQFQSGLAETFSALAERDADLYAKVIEYYLQKDDPLKVRPDSIIYNLIEKCGANHAYDIIKRNDFSGKHKWLFSNYYCLPLKDISAECIDQIYALYKEASINEMPYDMDYLIKYRSLDQHIILNVVTIILKRSVQESNLIHALHMLFNPYTEANKILTELFADNIEVLEKAYFAIAKIEKHEDYNGVTFARILALDPDFIYKHIDDIYERKEWVSRFDDTRDYSFLWKRDDWEEVVTKAINYIYEKEKERGTYLYSYAEVLFLNTINNDKIHPTENQKKLFHKLMIQRKDDSEFIQFLFGIISRFDPGDRLPFIASFLTHNNKYDDFRNLFLEPNSWSWSGSAIPMYQERITFYESILPMLKTVELLQHRQYIEQHINGLHMDIEREKRNNFLEDD